ncbi:MAG: DUF948 domain-containing protein [Actinobacteria bacterium]|jgi:cell division septation protein DedD|nr:MAG: DUF948 domain-containing protein [Actinomycetota bacterium]
MLLGAYRLLVSIGVIALIALGIIVLFRLLSLIMGAKKTLADLDRELIPTLLKLQKTLDDVREELDRVHTVMETLEEVGEKVAKTARLAQELVSSPLIKVAGIGAGARKALETLRGRE